MSERLTVTYRVRSDAAGIEARAKGIAVEQSVEMPLEAIDAPAVLSEIVGVVEAIEPAGEGVFSVRIGLALDTIGADAGQLMNMLFGNTSLQDDTILADVDIPPALAAAFGGPRQGLAALRHRLGVPDRAFTGSALKPQGLPVERLALLAERFALGGLDFIKDDHGLADQAYSPAFQRIPACAEAVARAARSTGHPTRYIPSLSGDLDAMRAQMRVARDAGLDCAMLAPMIAGFSTLATLAREFPDFVLFAHPALGGAARIAPDLLLGKLFRLFGAGGVIFPSYGGRFGYSTETCQRLAANARRTDDGLNAALPIPAGGMTLARTGEILDFYGPDTMLLIGGNLLMAREHIVEEAARFARAVATHRHGRA
jgi:ribulose-bisphosphate carboxylase large chain